MTARLLMQVKKSIITNEEFEMISAGIYILTITYAVYVIYRVRNR